jgi:hypothetical protein
VGRARKDAIGVPAGQVVATRCARAVATGRAAVLDGSGTDAAVPPLAVAGPVPPARRLGVGPGA